MKLTMVLAALSGLALATGAFAQTRRAYSQNHYVSLDYSIQGTMAVGIPCLRASSTTSSSEDSSILEGGTGECTVNGFTIEYAQRPSQFDSDTGSQLGKYWYLIYDPAVVTGDTNSGAYTSNANLPLIPGLGCTNIYSWSGGNTGASGSIEFGLVDANASGANGPYCDPECSYYVDNGYVEGEVTHESWTYFDPGADIHTISLDFIVDGATQSTRQDWVNNGQCARNITCMGTPSLMTMYTEVEIVVEIYEIGGWTGGSPVGAWATNLLEQKTYAGSITTDSYGAVDGTGLFAAMQSRNYFDDTQYPYTPDCDDDNGLANRYTSGYDGTRVTFNVVDTVTEDLSDAVGSGYTNGYAIRVTYHVSGLGG